MKHTYITRGVCARKINFEIQDGKIVSCSFIGGCEGNLNGICKLIEGSAIECVVEKLEGITCGNKKTSCPDQLAQALKEILENSP
jgi:uncharacterized protein (TIGR03905 family)